MQRGLFLPSYSARLTACFPPLFAYVVLVVLLCPRRHWELGLFAVDSEGGPGIAVGTTRGWEAGEGGAEPGARDGAPDPAVDVPRTRLRGRLRHGDPLDRGRRGEGCEVQSFPSAFA